MENITRATSTNKFVSFTDVYYDNEQYTLAKHDLWLRSRNGVLELKWSPETPSLTSPDKILHVDRYYESTDLQEIAGVLSRHIKILPQPTDILAAAKLTAFAEMTTDRRQYMLGIPTSTLRFSVDIDSVKYYAPGNKVAH